MKSIRELFNPTKEKKKQLLSPEVAHELAKLSTKKKTLVTNKNKTKIKRGRNAGRFVHVVFGKGLQHGVVGALQHERHILIGRQLLVGFILSNLQKE